MSIRQSQSLAPSRPHRPRSHPSNPPHPHRLPSRILLLLLACLFVAQPTFCAPQPQLFTDVMDPVPMDADPEAITTLARMLSDEYITEYVSMQDEDLFSWLGSRQGTVTLDVSRVVFSRFPDEYTQEQVEQSNGTLIRDILSHASGNVRPIRQTGLSSRQTWPLGEPQFRNDFFTLEFTLLDPKYINDHLVVMQLRVNSSIFDANATSPQNFMEKCIIESSQSPMQWACTNTVINYQPYNKAKVQNYYYTVVNYTATLTSGEKPEDIQLDIVFAQQSMGMNVNFHSKQPFTHNNWLLPIFFYCAFLWVMAGVQMFSANKMLQRLQRFAHGNKISILGINFCTISDLQMGIMYLSYAYNQQDSRWARAIFALTAIAYVVLYFVFNIRLQFRVLTQRFRDLAAGGAVERARRNIKCYLVGFELTLFFSYAAFVVFINLCYYESYFVPVLALFVFLPQIVRNCRVKNGGDGHFDYYYVLGYLATRYLVYLHERACPGNGFRIRPDLWVGLVLGIGGILQVGVLLGQAKLGSRFFVPRFLRTTYNYSHRVRKQELREEETCVVCMMQFMQPDRSDPLQQNEHGHYQNESQITEDQAIRRQDRGQSLVDRLLLRDTIKVYRTPCNHIFHKECLLLWMQSKMNCPTCRNELPAL